ncbi:MAG TPA: hypothetical protein VF331_22710 [Polyangiales bacterium]
MIDPSREARLPSRHAPAALHLPVGSRWLWLALLTAALGCGGRANVGAAPGSSVGTGSTASSAGAAGGSGPLASVFVDGGTADASAVLTGSSWPAPAGDCADMGRDCGSTACGVQTLCNVGVELCLPTSASALSLICSPGSCSGAAPYCVAGQCMTAAQASCVCAQSAAQTRLDACKGGPSAALGSPGACFAEQGICANAPDKCCAGLTCVKTADTLGQCFKPCGTDADCAGRCCVDTGAGSKVCEPGSTCGSATSPTQACAAQAAACSMDAACCSGLTCVQSDNKDFAGCRPSCKVAGDCASQCCQLFANSDNGFCADATYCMCLNAGMACGSTIPRACCTGTQCVGQSGLGFTCMPICTTSAECVSQCCQSIAGASYKVCSPQGPC